MPEEEYRLDEINENSFYMPGNAYAEKAGEYVSSLMSQTDSCGGIIECRADGLPVGLGETAFDKLDALLAQAVMSIGAVKGVEIGDGFAAAASTGSRNNDPFLFERRQSMQEDQPLGRNPRRYERRLSADPAGGSQAHLFHCEETAHR